MPSSAKPSASSKQSKLSGAFIRAFRAPIPDTDLAQLGGASFDAIVERHWRMSRGRKPGHSAIDIYMVKTGGHGADALRTAIDIVNDDMPFLVDSIAAALTARHRQIQLLLHPILHIGRDKSGKMTQVSSSAGDKLHAESHMHIELQGAMPAEDMREIERGLLRVLRDVRLATRDWQFMRERLRDCQKNLSEAAAATGDEGIEEYLSFLDYLYRDNFTLLGYRSYKFSSGQRSGVVKGSGLGLFSDEAADDELNAQSAALMSGQEKMRLKLPPVMVTKLERRATVHRAVPLDAITVRHFDSDGHAVGECVFVGLLTSVTYSRSIQDIPFLRRKADTIMHRSGFRPGSHDYKALRHILEKYPRDELFQIPDDALLETGLSILQLQERHRIALYTRPDPFGRYISCLVYVPRDRYDTRLRTVMQGLLEQALNGTCSNVYTTLDDSPLARVIYMVYTAGGPQKFSRGAVERALQDAGRLWSERLLDSLREFYDDEQVIAHYAQRYSRAFPAAYAERYESKQTIYDIEKIEKVLQSSRFTLDLYHDKSCATHQVRLKIYNRGQPIILSDALPVLENMGLKVIAELPFEVRPDKASESVWIHDFLMTADTARSPVDIPAIKDKFETALAGIWYGEVENDSLNELVTQGGMDWRQVQVLRTYVRYLRQAQYPFGTRYIERALTQNALIARQMVDLFHNLLSPAAHKNREKAAAASLVAIEDSLEKVVSLDIDRILRAVLLLIQSTLRTNFFQGDASGGYKTYLSIKLDSRKITFLPEPKPFREIFVYSPRMEGIHLRMDWIARGGIRWSDRHEDFRTEVLGLMKAQQVKNAVIVPMGAKGGFIVKNPPVEGGREAFQREGIECYKILVRGLLDITDNRKGTKIVPPRDVVRRDQDDPYLVVAADKGTATFSDIANGLSLEYGFWLGDAFASGGSAGYDHKGIGITARGAWESVKRHFREMNHDTQTQPFDVIGVGDMAGDVFGNGMLQSDQIRMVGAFNHVHIVCDPNPDPASSFKERARLFKEVKGWDHYDVKKLSKGGRIYNRSEKSLKLTPEIKARFDLTADSATPAELIQAILRARADLLFFGGIGTYIKAMTESHADVGDKGNDSLRVDGNDIRASVIGEGANLAITQNGRIELAKGGKRLNTDFVDNSAGVDTSDHEVNIKILFSAVMEDNPALTVPKRNTLLRSMTEEVAALVLRDNYQQTQGLSLTAMQAPVNLSIHAAFIKAMERLGVLNRKIEFLPDEESIDRRKAMGKGLTRPELSVLTSYAKILLARDLLASDIPDNKDLEPWLVDYFPTPLRKTYIDGIRKHRLRREIIATMLSSDLVNRMGPTFVRGLMDKTGASCEDTVRAWLIVRDAFNLPALWAEVEALDAKVPAEAQLQAMLDIARMAERETIWFLTRMAHVPDISRNARDFGDGIAVLQANLSKVATPNLAASLAQRLEAGLARGLPPELARKIAAVYAMGASCDIIRIANDNGTDIPTTARTYFELGEYFHLDWLRIQARALPASDRWTAEALKGLIDQLYGCQAGLTARILKDMRPKKSGADGKGMMDRWLETNGHQARQIEPLIADMRKSGTLDVPMLILAEQRLRHVYGG